MRTRPNFEMHKRRVQIGEIMQKKVRPQTEEEWEIQMCEKLLRYVRDVLYVELPFMGRALSAFSFRADGRLNTFATDGIELSYSTEQLIRVFKGNAPYLNRLYLHTVLHCIFSHLWLAGGRQPYLWGIACDIAVEYTIDHMEKECVKRIPGWLRQKTYEALEQEEGISAAQIYRWLKGQKLAEPTEFHQEFFADDHVFWPREKQQQEEMVLAAKNNWGKIARQTNLEQKRKGDDTGEGQSLLDFQMKAGRSRRSYREFLRKFAVLKEELHCDLDEFDLSCYLYGLSMYGNLPLIEPLESREVHKIRDFAVVVDTSYSTSGELVQGFLKETFHLLRQEDSFFHHVHIHIIQCDDKVQSDTLITSDADLERLFKNFTLQGGGGTDFRPAFAYVDGLVRSGELQDLCGLLYFTDGKGIYPKKRPEYKTAFLFLESGGETPEVPAWAIRMQLEPEEFTENGSMT